jgi:tetratricopeptide (TPR) repeat protein
MTTDILEIARLKDAAGQKEATAEDQVACAQKLLDARLPDQALPYLLRASEEGPSAQLAALAGSVAVSIGDLECAASQFGLQLSRDPEAPEPFVNLALIEASQENWTQAAERFRETLHRSPEEAEWHNDLGVVLFKLEDYVGATRALKEAVRLKADYADAAFKASWQERPLHASVYDREYFETHLGTEETTCQWQQHRGRKLDRRFETVAPLARVSHAQQRDQYEQLWELTQSLFGDSDLSPAARETTAGWAYLHERILLHSGAASPSSKLVMVRKELNCG